MCHCGSVFVQPDGAGRADENGEEFGRVDFRRRAGLAPGFRHGVAAGLANRGKDFLENPPLELFRRRQGAVDHQPE
jgi:hypothetical protein